MTATPSLESQIERAVAAAGLMVVNGWRPIETLPAPTRSEDEWIIGYTSWGQQVGKFHEHIGPCEWFSSGWEFRNIDFDAFPRPTHWMPWPADRPNDVEGAAGA